MFLQNPARVNRACNEDSALSRRLDSLNSQVGDSRATLAQLQQVVSDAESARAGMTQSLEA